MSLAEHHLEAVRDFVAANHPVTARVMAVQLRLNSGIVSRALQKLEADGTIEAIGTDHGKPRYAPKPKGPSA